MDQRGDDNDDDKYKVVTATRGRTVHEWGTGPVNGNVAAQEKPFKQSQTKMKYK